jgi:hypothetical protein
VTLAKSAHDRSVSPAHRGSGAEVDRRYLSIEVAGGFIELVV